MAGGRTTYYDSILTERGKEMVRKTVPTFTYKPGWSFHVIERGDDLLIEAHHTELDSRYGTEIPDFPRRIQIVWPHYTVTDAYSVAAWVRHCIHEWECHEADEWLKIGGKRFHDPHECRQCKIGGCRA